MKMTRIEGFRNPKNHLNTRWKVSSKEKRKKKFDNIDVHVTPVSIWMG
jgi:hypothetical protein